MTTHLDQLVVAIAERAAEIVLERISPADAPAQPELLTVSEAAELMRCTRQRIYDLLSSRRLPRLRDGTRVLIERQAILEYLAADATAALTGPLAA